LRLTKLLLVAILFMASVESVLALSATIGNAKMILRPDITPGEVTRIQKSILIKNVNEYPVTVTLTPDDTLAQIINMPTTEYKLQPDEQVDVPFTITLTREGKYDGKIFVLFKPDDPNIRDSPVGLTSRVIIVTSGYTGEEETETPENESVRVQEQPTQDNETAQVEEGNVTPAPRTPTQPQHYQTVGSKTPNPVVAIVTVLVVVLVGGIISYFILRKVW